jgi:DNA uptake protein ComE-like DNA-binding protein
MSQSSWFKQRPTWINIALFPIIGGGAIAYAGYVVKNNIWIGIGIGFVSISAAASILPSGIYALIFWSLYLGQVATAFMFRQEFLAKTYPRHLPLPDDVRLFQAVAAGRPKVEINTCSKDDLVNRLGVSIIYANDIIALREEGYTFTHAEELTEILGVPPMTVQRISPFITFSYYEQQNSSWKRVNHFKVDELVKLGLEPEVAMAIALERTNGEYKSLMDIKKRTGIPFNSFRQLS